MPRSIHRKNFSIEIERGNKARAYMPSRYGEAAALNERNEICVDLTLVSRTHAVRQSGINLQRRIFYQLGRKHGRIGDWDNLIVAAMQDERGDVELLEIFRHVGFGKRFDAKVGCGKTARHRLKPKRVP